MTENSLNINTEDTELINAFTNGNQNAFNIIIRKYQKRVYWIIRKMVLDHDDADDITQEVFLKLYRSLNDFRGESKFFTYVYKIAINYSLNHIIKNKKIITRKVNIEYADLKSHDKKADDQIDSNQRTKILEQAIASLPEQQRAVFNMRYYDNLTYDEISDIMDKSIGGMKANYFHAIKKLEKFLKGNKTFQSLEIN
ncbi:MAG: sigma-70 family RNA polymerase sigma factor [Bacteroidota bacterium]|nr:sigma-70 family RNA polymerase sigma factor [Bacteroidota bacterium]